MHRDLHSSRWFRRISGAIALPFVLLMVAILVVMGLTGNFQVSSARKLFEKMYARRLGLTVADSAFEEVSAKLEEKFSNIPFPAERIYTNKTLDTELPWSEVANSAKNGEFTSLTTEAFKEEKVELKVIDLKTSDWKTVTNPEINQIRQKLQAKETVNAVVHEVGILQIKLRVSIESGSTKVDQEIQTRRYMAATVDGPGENACKLKIQPRNMVTIFPEIEF